MPLGDYGPNSGPSGNKLFGVFQVQVTKSGPRRRGDGSLECSNKTNRVRYQVDFTVLGPNFAGEHLQRTMDVAWGKNSENGKFSAMARYVEWATGIPAGDSKQQLVEDEELVGTIGFVFVKHSGGYNNIDDFLDAETAGQAAPVVQPASTIAKPPYKRVQETEVAAQRRANAEHERSSRPAPTPTTSSSPTNTNSPAISTGKTRQVEALQKAKRVSDSDLANLVGRLTNGRTRHVAGLTMDEADAICGTLKELVAA